MAVDNLSKLKIAKKAYVFDTRRKFAATQNFVVKKKPENAAEDLKANVMALFAKKKPTDAAVAAGAIAGKKTPEKSAGEPAAQQPAIKGPLLSPLLMAIIVVAVLVLGGGLFLMFKLGEVQMGAQGPPAKHVFGGAYDYTVMQSRVLSIGSIEKPERAAYFLLDYGSANLSYMNFTANLYSDHPPSQVFLLDYTRNGADSYPVFRKELLSGLASAGLPASEVEIGKAAFLPAGSLLIVPTGYFPEELLGMNSNFNFKDLLARGVTIVYIGLPFDDKALSSSGLVNSNFSELAFSVPEVSDQAKSTDGFSLSNARYIVTPVQTGRGHFSSVAALYGSVSAVRYGGGYMIFLPQSLDGGWHADGGKQAATDILRLIVEERWLAPVASAAVPADLSDGQHLVSLFAEPFPTDSTYVQLVVDTADGQGIARSSRQVFNLQKTQKGEMTPVEPETVPYYLSGGKTSLNIKLLESSAQPVKLYVRMYKDGTLNQTSEVEQGLTNPNSETFPELEVDAEPGNYTVLVEDDNGKVYAATQLSVIGLDVYQNLSDWQGGHFSFILSANGEAVSPPDFSISLDGQKEKQYYRDSLTYTEDRTATVANYDYGEAVKTGKHVFLLSFAGKWVKEMDITYTRSPPFWENPINIFLGIVSLVTVGIGVMLRRPEVLKYGLDIPDFPPLSTIKIPVKKQTVLELFDAVNAGYSWQWMPLRTDELKNGFRKLTYNGKPILIGDFNLERILAHLRTEGLVKDEIGYWGKSSWEKDSRHTIAYLTMYRIMRNVFVNNAVKFSKLDAMPDCDVKAIAGKEEIYLHIMEEPFERVVHRALATSKRGTTIMVFKTDEERDAFKDSLTSTSKLAVGLKMEVNGGSILLLPVRNAISAYLKGINK